MILIGLFGGSPESREKISDAMQRFAGASFGAYCQYPGQGVDGPGRGETLEVVLRGLGTKVKGGGLILPHVMSLEEANVIRARGGRLLFLQGEPSDVIPIQREDLPVTAKTGGHQHYLDPFEALSQVLLTYGQAL